jgi:hypothetical protein
VHVFTLNEDQYKEKGIGFPASASGRTVYFLPKDYPFGVQYSVKQIPYLPGPVNRTVSKYAILAGLSYSHDCDGLIKPGENKTCYINNFLNNTE